VHGPTPTDCAHTARRNAARDAFADSPDALIILDSVGIVADIDDDGSARFGLLRAAIVGRPVAELLHERDRERACAVFLRDPDQVTTPAWSISVLLRRGDGSWTDVEVISTNAVNDPGVAGIVLAIRDVSGPNLGNRVLAAGRYLHRSLDTPASDGTTIFDAAGRRVFSSTSLCTLLGYSPEELASIAPAGLMHPDDLSLWKSTVREALTADGKVARVECRIMRADGSPMWMEGRIVNLLNDPEIRGVVAHIRDIDGERRAAVELLQLANTDSLTGLGNRRALMSYLREQPVGTPCAILFCDLDGFKAVNDTFGHQIGDVLLQRVGREIELVLGPAPCESFAARVGGDEFCVFLLTGSVGEATGVAEKIRSAVRAMTLASAPEVGMDVTVDMSIGVAVSDGSDAAWADRLLREADNAMYRAKRVGGGSRIHVVCEPEHSY
jgi:diguanylate cyclase (GGDEF)-like protein/PAS domain S-box-containing protein